MTELPRLYFLIGLEMLFCGFQEIALFTIFEIKGRTKTNTGRWVEYTKALERTVLKELGKLHP